jgi:glutathione S-transferase
LPALDFFSKTDPIVILYTKAEGAEDKWDKFDQTECVVNNLAPVFAKTFVVDWNVKTELKFEVLDMDDKKLDDVAKAQFIGSFTVSLADLVCIGGATGRKRLHWTNGNVLVNGSISIFATVIGDDLNSVKAQAKEFVDVMAQRKACTLYWSPYCPASFACAAVVKAAFSKEVRLQQLGKDTKLENNPSGELPFLDDAGFRLDGANAIIRYLCLKATTGSPLYPVGWKARAKVEEALDWHLANTARGRDFLAPKFGATVTQAAQDEGKRWYDLSLSRLDGILAGQAFLAGADLTIADIVVFVEVALLPSAATEGLPNLVRWLQAMTAYDSVVTEAKQVMV